MFYCALCNELVPAGFRSRKVVTEYKTDEDLKPTKQIKKEVSACPVCADEYTDSVQDVELKEYGKALTSAIRERVSRQAERAG